MSTRSPEAAAGEQILRLVDAQVSLGPRAPGTDAHAALARSLEEELRAHADEVEVQPFRVPFRGREVACANVAGIFRCHRAPGVRRPPLLLGSHYDTRVRADRDPDPGLRETPIPGANDGGSGTAVLQHMLPRLAAADLDRDVAVAFFDAEDMGNIDGKEFALGSAYLADHPVAGFVPSEAVILDMVGGAGMVLDIDAHILGFPASRRVTTGVFRAGIARGWHPFAGDKPQRVKYIISDHSPFQARGIGVCLLIDIDYPQWHTQADLPDAMSAESLGIIEEALWLYLLQQPA